MFKSWVQPPSLTSWALPPPFLLLQPSWLLPRPGIRHVGTQPWAFAVLFLRQELLQSLLLTLRIPGLVVTSSGRPSLTVISSTHSTSPHPFSLSCLAVLKRLLFYVVLLFVCLPHFRMWSLWKQGFVVIGCVSPQHLGSPGAIERVLGRQRAIDWTAPGSSLLLFPWLAASSTWTGCPTVSMGLNCPLFRKQSAFPSFSIREWSSTHLICVAQLVSLLLFVNMVYLYCEAGPSWRGCMFIPVPHLGLTRSREVLNLLN